MDGWRASGGLRPAQSGAKPSKLPVVLLAIVLVLLLFGAVLMYELIRTNPKYLTSKAFANTFFDASAKSVSVSGDAYVELLDAGELYGVQFDGAIAYRGAMDLRLESRLLVSGSKTKLIKASASTPVYGQISGIADITQMFVVGASSQDIAMHKLLSKHGKRIDGVWYSFADEKFTKSIKPLGLPFVLPVGLTDSQQALLARTYARHAFLVHEAQYRGEILLQKPTVQYELRIDIDTFKQFMNELSRQDPTLVQASDIDMIAADVQRITSLQIWINPGTQRLEQFRLVYMSADSSKRYSLRLRMQPTNTSVEPAQPTEAKPVSDLQTMMGLR
jgi:hypothetical protein